MADSADNRRFSHAEFVRVLRTAATLQDTKRIPVRAEGFTLVEMEQIGADVGISAEFIRQAVSTIEEAPPRFADRLLGGSRAVQLTHHMHGDLDETVLPGVVDEIRRAIGKQGEVQHVLGSLEWHHKDELTSVHVSVARRGDTLRVQLLTDRDNAAGLVLTLVPIVSLVGSSVVAGALGMNPAEIVITLGSGLTVGVLGMRAAWRASTRSWRRKFSSLLGRLVETLSAAQSKQSVPEPRTDALLR